MDRARGHDDARGHAIVQASGREERPSGSGDRLASVAARRGQARDIRRATAPGERAVQATPNGEPGAPNAPTEGEAAPEGGGAAAVHQRFPRGFPVALSLQVTEADRAGWRAGLRGRTLRQALGDSNRYRRNSAYQRLWARRDTPEGQQVVSAEDIQVIVAARENNDDVFEGEAEKHAANRGSVALVGGAPVIGQHISFTRQDADPLGKVEAVSAAVGPLRGGASGSGSTPATGDATPETGATTPAPGDAAPAAEGGQANVAELAIFTHGQRGAIEVGQRGHGGWLGMAGVRADLASSLAQSVDIQLYACSSGGGDHSLAEELTRSLAADGHDVTTLAHTNAAHATRNPNARIFSAQAGGDTVDVSHINDLAFTAAFVAGQVEPTATALGLSDAQRAGLGERLGDLMRAWAAREQAWQRVMVDATQAGGDTTGARMSPAALVVGTEPDRACAAIRDAWVDGHPAGVARGVDSRAVLDPLLGSGARRRRQQTRAVTRNQIYAAVFEVSYARAQAAAIAEALNARVGSIMSSGFAGEDAAARGWLDTAMDVVMVDAPDADGAPATRAASEAFADARDAVVQALRTAWENGQGTLPSGQVHFRASLSPLLFRRPPRGP